MIHTERLTAIHAATPLLSSSVQFSDARAKIKRANKHIADLEHRLAEIPDSRRSSVEIDPNTRYKSLKHDIVDEQWVTDVPLLIGDVIHRVSL